MGREKKRKKRGRRCRGEEQDGGDSGFGRDGEIFGQSSQDLAAAFGAERIPGVIVSRYFAAGEVWGVPVVASIRRIQGAFTCG